MPQAKKISPVKAKLRPARDVLSRLRWGSESITGGDQVVFGYIDRINGTMEKSVEDFRSIADGGDIPEHRILYFRRVRTNEDGHTNLSKNIIWDRAGRIDRVFDSGYCNKDVSSETIKEAAAAICNMARLEAEKADRREQKERVRARRARAKAGERRIAYNNTSDLLNGNTNELSGSRQRFHWKSIPQYYFDDCDKQWRQVDAVSNSTNLEKRNAALSVLTWNVLSNIYPGIDTDEEGSHKSRWSILAQAIHEQSPDVVALQEAVPDFVIQLLQIGWVRQEYASSVSPNDKTTIGPIGQVLLWKRSFVDARELHACVDGVRIRALSATLSYGHHNICVCANVHLPSDKPSTKEGEKISRQLARRRELSSVVGHLQKIESQFKRAKPQNTTIDHLIVGDFNCISSELDDGNFGNGYFEEVLKNDQRPAATFCPESNPRAAWSASLVSGSTHGRRIDRMYLNARSQLRPLKTSIIHGKYGCALPPSDHYGVLSQFGVHQVDKGAALYNTCKQYNAWAAFTPPSKDFMLAITLDSEDMEKIKVAHDSASSLIIPHISLLYGFVELYSGSLDLAIEAVRDSISSAFSDMSLSPKILSFSDDSLDVFEHRSSATLVARPERIKNKWLMDLYGSLRSSFCLCSDQEMHSLEGFNPHVTLGKFGFASAARQAAAEYVSTVAGLEIPIRSVDILERSPSGKFRTVATVPFSNVSSHHPKGLKYVITDTARIVSSSFMERSKVVLSHIAQASRVTARSFQDLHIVSKCVPYGSVALDCPVPKMSDLDVVIMIGSTHEDVLPSQLLALADKECIYLKKVMSCLGETRSLGKMRLRTLRSGLNVLSIQTQPDLPPADILLLVLGPNGQPVGNDSDGPFDCILDNEFVLNTLASIEERVDFTCNNFSLKDIFCASLRLIVKGWRDLFKRAWKSYLFTFEGFLLPHYKREDKIFS